MFASPKPAVLRATLLKKTVGKQHIYQRTICFNTARVIRTHNGTNAVRKQQVLSMEKTTKVVLWNDFLWRETEHLAFKINTISCSGTESSHFKTTPLNQRFDAAFCSSGLKSRPIFVKVKSFVS